ncbi:MAG: DEAD/DEAH box helicase [Burkholderiaceae bacterium]|nr:DEAD/DEAH box helicase [Burkholderiaceae bacterium]
MDAFHPAVERWFRRAFPGGPTAAQLAAWPAIAAGRNTLVAAPTGSGKTLTAFLTAIDSLVREGLKSGGLPDETAIVYVSPLKALSNDIHCNLEAPLAGIRDELAALGLPDVDIRTAVRTGDTSQRERTLARRKPPHVLVTTPESLYVLLGSETGRAMLRTVRTVIVDEIHAVAASKRGSHLALSLERLEKLATAAHGRRLVRIGLSATQKPIDEIARFLVGAPAVRDGRADCEIVDIGYAKERDLALVVPPTPLSAVMSNDQWAQVYDQLAALACAHRTTLVFVNTRRMAERAARHLAERLGEVRVAAHHGSLAREKRFDAERRLKNGELQALVATASLELGLDIGDVDLVCQIGSPRSISTFLQRAGRSGHSVGGTPKARLFPGTRDELVECAALLDCVRRGELDALRIPKAPLDVLAQQLVAEVASGDCGEDELFVLVRRAWPYAKLAREDFCAVVRMLSEGFATRNGTRSTWLHRDAVNRRLRPRRGARLTALTSGGTIPDTGDYAVVLEPDALVVGTVNEDFAVESLAGDVFQLGNVSYRIRRVEPGRVRVEDARGAPPSIPFWLGEAPGRSDELSAGVSRLRSEIERRLAGGNRKQAAANGSVGQEGSTDAGRKDAHSWLVSRVGLDDASATQIVDYLHRARVGLGALPTQRRIVLERFLDESGGAQLIVHSPFGSRINRAWGLALRKRFCRKFDFELQAAATEDAIVLSLSTSHSFALAEVARYLHSASALDVLVQAVLAAPLFGARWRWNATTALALPRFSGGRKVAPPLQRMKSEDLLAAVFPDQVACAENLAGEREVPDHPLVAQTLADCLNDAMDAPGWLRLLQSIERADVEVVARDLVEPSPLASEAIAARVYAFLDDAPLEERRTEAVRSRRHLDPDSADDLGRLDAQAIEAVRREAWPQAQNADELHEALTGIVALSATEVRSDWEQAIEELATARRATRLVARQSGTTAPLWIAAERLPLVQAVFPERRADPSIEAPAEYAQQQWTREEAVRELVRGRLGVHGPVTAAQLTSPIGLAQEDVKLALVALEQEGSVMRGRFTPDADDEQWCERHLLARIHRLTLQQLRREIEPVEPRDLARFLFEWQHVAPSTRVSGAQALAAILAQLEGFEAPASAWESEILSARVEDYELGWLDELCTAGRIVWTRLRAPAMDEGRPSSGASLRTTPLLLLPRANVGPWTRLAPAPGADAPASARAQRVLRHLEAHGASFFDEIAEGTRLLRSELEDALSELVAHGRVRCDSYAGLRALLVPASRRAGASAHRRRNATLCRLEDAGRWALARRGNDAPRGGEIEHVARALLRRYGVVCWRLLEREAAWLPPWRELVRVYQRLEARGEIRGGRFIAGVSGEQFALPDAITTLRRTRRSASGSPEWICVAAADPSNLLGSLLPGARVPRVGGARVLYRDGVPFATLLAERIEWLQRPDPEERGEATQLLLGRRPRVARGTPLAAHSLSGTPGGKPR